MADERDELELREDESPEERDRRVLEERYGLKPRVRYMAAESVFDTSIDGGTDAQLARAYPTVAAAATKNGSDEEAAVLNAETPAARQEVYEQVQADKSTAGVGEGEQPEEAKLADYDNVTAKDLEGMLDERGVDYNKSDSKREKYDALKAALEDANKAEESAQELHTQEYDPSFSKDEDAKSSVELEDSEGVPYEEQPEGQKADIEAGFVARGDAEKVEGQEDESTGLNYDLPENVSDPNEAQGDSNEE